MNKQYIMIISVLVLAVALIGGFFVTNTLSDGSDGENMQESQSTTSDSLEDNKTVGEIETAPSSDEMSEDRSSAPAAAAVYIPYSPDTFAQTAETRRVLFFYANWCPTCASADAAFSESVAVLPADVTLMRVNYNDTDTDQNESELAEKYAVTYQHTFVQIDEDGAVQAIWNGGEIEELLDNLR